LASGVGVAPVLPDEASDFPHDNRGCSGERLADLSAVDEAVGVVGDEVLGVVVELGGVLSIQLSLLLGGCGLAVSLGLFEVVGGETQGLCQGSHIGTSGWVGEVLLVGIHASCSPCLRGNDGNASFSAGHGASLFRRL